MRIKISIASKLTFLRVHVEFLAADAHLFGFAVLFALVLPIQGLQLGHHLSELIFELL